MGAQHASGDVLVFLSPTARVITPEWLDELLMYAQRADVGAVGALMTLPSQQLWHTGMIFAGPEGLPIEPLRRFPYGYSGYMGRLCYAQNISALSGDCLMVRKETFFSAGGFDAKFQCDYYDADLCLRLREQGYLNVWTPFARLTVSPNKAAENAADAEAFVQRWSGVLHHGDPYYNPNFSTSKEGFRLS